MISMAFPMDFIQAPYLMVPSATAARAAARALASAQQLHPDRGERRGRTRFMSVQMQIDRIE